MPDTPSNSGSSRKLTLKGRYEVDRSRQIGCGGIAVVYPGIDLASGVPIAAKHPLEKHRTNPDVLRRFNNESRMNRFISPHPQVVGWVDYIPGGPWIVMEFVNGKDLKKILSERGQLPLDEAVDYLRQVTIALDSMHERSVAHLDIKPQNLLIDDQRQVKLIDFGLAQEFANQQDTVGEHLFGTAAYMAPEQINFQPIGGYTDVYALGCVFHEMVTGSPPFVAEGLSGEAEQRALVDMQRFAEPKPPSQVRPDLNFPVWVDDVVGRAMEKDPEHRFESAGAFAEYALREGRGKRVTIARQNGPVHTTAMPPDQSPETVTHIEADEAVEAEPRGPGLARRAWTAGGNRLQNSTHLRGIAWRLSLLAAIVAVVASLNVASDGSLTQLVALGLEAAPAITAEVSEDRVNVRTEPTRASESKALLNTGDTVEITGLPQDGDSLEWWPVTVEVNGQREEGWIYTDGVDATSWMRILSVPDAITDGADKVSGWWP